MSKSHLFTVERNSYLFVYILFLPPNIFIFADPDVPEDTFYPTSKVTSAPPTEAATEAEAEAEIAVEEDEDDDGKSVFQKIDCH